MTRLLLPFRIVLAILAAAARCFRAQPVTNGQGASEHLRTQVTAAELFYLRHLRTCAASSSGSRSTCSAAAPCLCTSGFLVVLDCIMLLVKVVLQDMLQALEFVMSMFVKLLRSTPQILEHLMSMFTAVLQSMPSPLEICAFIAVVDVSEGKNCFQIALAVTNLLLAVCDWHVPQVIPHHNFLCRFLSAICMQALFPYLPTSEIKANIHLY